MLDTDNPVTGAALPAWIAAAVLAVLVLGAALLPNLPTGADHRRARQVLLTLTDGPAPIVTYDPAVKRLTLTDHLAADALVCMGGVCQRPANWVTVAGGR